MGQGPPACSVFSTSPPILFLSILNMDLSYCSLGKGLGCGVGEVEVGCEFITEARCRLNG
jgi:hypothetical protein